MMADGGRGGGGICREEQQEPGGCGTALRSEIIRVMQQSEQEVALTEGVDQGSSTEPRGGQQN